MDIVDTETRSKIMSRVKGKHTKPELIIRTGLHRKGFRYRLHDRRLPGHPDLVFAKYKAIVLVNGCFWHDHGCYLSSKPATRKKFWDDKFERNRQRDLRNINLYLDAGWRILIVWECALKGKQKKEPVDVIDLLARWLEDGMDLQEISGDNESIYQILYR